MSDLIFSKRMKLEKEYLAWIAKNNLENCASNMIAFLDGKKKLLHDLTDLPTYYILRRTVGGAQGRYQWWDANDWVDENRCAWLYLSEENAKKVKTVVRGENEIEIIPIKLVEVPHES
jgi:hypothetical protein